MACPSIQDIARYCEVEESLLDQKVDSISFYDISKHLSKWKLLASRVNITQTEVNDIEKDNQKAVMQRMGFLSKWKEKMSIKATYRALMKSLLDIDESEAAQGVCQVLKGMEHGMCGEGGQVTWG